MANYLKYLGDEPYHTVAVTAPGTDPDNPLSGSSAQTITTQPGGVVGLHEDVAAAVLAKEPTLWEAVSGFDA